MVDVPPRTSGGLEVVPETSREATRPERAPYVEIAAWLEVEDAQASHAKPQASGELEE